MITLPNIVKLMHKAGEHLKHPKCLVRLSEGTNIRLTVATNRAKFPGSINILSNAGFHESKFYGRIFTNGTLALSKPAFIGENLHAQIAAALQEFNADPRSGASLYGSKTAHCCFCGTKLSTKESLTTGYGPTCAENYGLPWGHIDPDVTEKHRHDLEKIMQQMESLPNKIKRPKDCSNVKQPRTFEPLPEPNEQIEFDFSNSKGQTKCQSK